MQDGMLMNCQKLAFRSCFRIASLLMAALDIDLEISL